MTSFPLLSDDPNAPFPPAETALHDPEGLLAAGGDLSPARLLNAYSHGIFPWFSEGMPILWWCPDPRMVFRTDRIRFSSRFRRQLRRCHWSIRADTAFAGVLAACAETPRPKQDGTWITADMRIAYTRLHHLGYAHSVEVFDEDLLVGGIYGIAIGRMYFGESMFSRKSGASKIALAALAARLAQWGWPLIDAQVENSHLLRLGAERCPRSDFLRQVAILTAQPAPDGHWNERFGELTASTLA
ncbi:MAG: leucyl/phenylalanyl-tRNA--protein transferase [Xanthomonadaceae bacterium]|jgi:leucyl/phenylalanyl-tRNA--protein transferase|nr:leucyl/phenylalanyl-tRNA--protein transferase [Xanthomonadaceae bacterium]